MKLLTKLYLAFGLILLVFSFVTVTYIRQSRAVSNEMRLVIGSTEIIRLIENNLRAILDMETGLRGFLIGEREIFLEPYYKGEKEMTSNLNALAQKTPHPKGKQLIKEIKILINSWEKTFAHPLITAKREVIHNHQNNEEYNRLVNEIVKPGKGKQIIDQIRKKFAEFEDYEDQIKNSQINSLHSSMEFTQKLSVILTISATIFGIVTAFLLGKTIHNRLSTMINLAKEISGGNFDIKITDNAKDEMSELSTSLNSMAGQLKQYFTNLTKTNKELDQFAYVVSHDLKAPLRAINNLSEWMLEDHPDLDIEIRTNLGLMRSRAHRMENLINGILDYARIGRKEIPQTTFYVKDLLAEVIDSISPPATVNITLPPKLPTLTSEKILLYQIFTNLLSNAIKYNDKPTTEILISYQLLEDCHLFAITDNGPGIPKEYSEKVFGIFQTMEARDTKESTGVGLAIVKKIITEKESQIWIEDNTPNPGVTFLFTWPKNS